MNKDLISSNCIFYNYNDNIIHSILSSNNSNKYISEIVSYNLFLDDKINKINNIKQKITNYNDYFYLFIDYHRILLKDIDEDNEMRSNIHIIKDIKKNNEIIGDYLFKYEKIQFIYLKYYLKSLSSSRKYLFQLINFYKYLLDGLQKLVNINIVHCNIQLDNLIIDINKENTIFLTDFSYLIKIQNNNQNEYLYIKNRFQEFNLKNNMDLPIEFYILFYMITNRITSLSQYNIHNIVDTIYKNQYIYLQQSFGNDIYAKYIDDSKEYYSKYVNKTIDYIWSDMCNWFYTWDNYSVSIVYLKILIGLHTHLKNKIIANNNECKLENSIIKNKFLIDFMKLLVINIHPNPIKRKNISETLEIFNKIIYSCETNVFIELINNI